MFCTIGNFSAKFKTASKTFGYGQLKKLLVMASINMFCHILSVDKACFKVDFKSAKFSRSYTILDQSLATIKYYTILNGDLITPPSESAHN